MRTSCSPPSPLSSLLVSATAAAGEPSGQRSPCSLGPSGRGRSALSRRGLATCPASCRRGWRPSERASSSFGLADTEHADPLALAGVLAGPGNGRLGRLRARPPERRLRRGLLRQRSWAATWARDHSRDRRGILRLLRARAPAPRTAATIRSSARSSAPSAGFVIGGAVGATIGWHVKKHRRGQSPATAGVPAATGRPPRWCLTSGPTCGREQRPARRLPRSACPC